MSLDKINQLVNGVKQNAKLSEVAKGVLEENSTIFDENKTSYDSYNQVWDENWEDVEFKSNKFLFFDNR
ncbi:hypothetical protein IJ670_02660 [bacterium]|nr:hypothetical protein [bacterium]